MLRKTKVNQDFVIVLDWPSFFYRSNQGKSKFLLAIVSNVYIICREEKTKKKRGVVGGKRKTDDLFAVGLSFVCVSVFENTCVFMCASFVSLSLSLLSVPFIVILETKW